MGIASCVVETQSLFVPCLSRLLGEAGLDVAHVAPSIDVALLAKVRPEALFVDLDCIEDAPLERLRIARALLPETLVFVYTHEREPSWFDQCRTMGADCVVDKAASEREFAFSLSCAVKAYLASQKKGGSAAGSEGLQVGRCAIGSFGAAPGGLDGPLRPAP